MESIGQKLRQTRETKGYTIEQIARDTHIAKRFLEALESEDFAVFPGDPYLLGFMRTYSEYLGLDPEEVVALYKNLKLQEQPAPIDELISKSPRRPAGLIIGIVAVVVVALGVGGYFLFTSGILERDQAEVEVPVVDAPDGTVFELTGEWVEQRFARGDRIMVPVAGETIAIDLQEVDDGLTVSTPGGSHDIPVGEETGLDLNSDGRTDLRVTLRSVDLADSPPTVVMRVNRGAEDALAAAAEGTEAAAEGNTTVAAAGVTAAVGSTSQPDRVQEAVTIAEFDEREEFMIEVRFEGYTFFRYEIDDQPRVEQYFQNDQTLRTSVQDRFKLWVSNAGAARLRVAGQDLVLGDDGEVSAALVTWADVPDSTNVSLELVPVY